MFSPSFVKFWIFVQVYRTLVICGQAPFLNELIKANQRTKFHFFSIIIDLESPEIIYCSGLIKIEKKNRD